MGIEGACNIVFPLFSLKLCLGCYAEEPRLCCKQKNAEFERVSWKVMMLSVWLISLYVYVRPVCKLWSRTVQFKTQKRWRKTKWDCWTSEYLRVRVISTRLNFSDEFWWHFLGTSRCVCIFNVIFVCGVWLVLCYNCSWGEDRTKASVYSRSKEEDVTVVRYRLLTICGGNRWYAMLTDFLELLCKYD